MLNSGEIPGKKIGGKWVIQLEQERDLVKEVRV